VRSFLPLLVLTALSCRNENGVTEQTAFDSWTQADNDRVDILFVVDDSGTMAEEQATLARGFASFASILNESMTRFHLGVISTSFEYGDPDRGKLIGDPLFLTHETPDYESLFAERAVIGTGGSDFEKGLEAAAYALSPAIGIEVNVGFSRPEARLLIVFVSDEEDCSDAGALGTDFSDDGEICYSGQGDLVPVPEFVEEFRNLREDPRDVIVTSIVGLPGERCDTDNDGEPDALPGARYAEVARLTGGNVGDICDSDWTQILSEAGLNATGVDSSFQLGNAAIPDTLEVMVDDAVVDPASYTYEPETWFIHFADDAVPPRESVITASYTVLPGQPRPPGL
jgi:hypothetical protein